jgi:hypothetical protein
VQSLLSASSLGITRQQNIIPCTMEEQIRLTAMVKAAG